MVAYLYGFHFAYFDGPGRLNGLFNRYMFPLWVLSSAELPHYGSVLSSTVLPSIPVPNRQIEGKLRYGGALVCGH